MSAHVIGFLQGGRWLGKRFGGGSEDIYSQRNLSRDEQFPLKKESRSGIVARSQEESEEWRATKFLLPHHKLKRTYWSGLALNEVAKTRIELELKASQGRT